MDTGASLSTDRANCAAAAQYLCALACQTSPSASVKTGGNAAILNRR
jgi:hypothetical protein